MVARLPAIAVPIHNAVTAGAPFEGPRDHLLVALAEALVVHTEFDKASQQASRDDAPVGVLTAAMAAQHRSLAARVDELAQATSGLDAVAITRAIHTILNLTLDLERRILHLNQQQAPASRGPATAPRQEGTGISR